MHDPRVKSDIPIPIYERPGEWNEVLLRIWPLGGEPVRWPGERRGWTATEGSCFSATGSAGQRTTEPPDPGQQVAYSE